MSFTDSADTIPDDKDTVFDTDSVGKPQEPETIEPLYRIYAGSRIAIGAGVGMWWKRKLDAALTAYDPIYKVWEEIFKYYNNNQTKSMETPRGVFRRGDSTENVVYSNLNVMLPAVYSKDPDVTCNTTDEGDADFCKSLAALLNVLFKRKDILNAKPKIKKATGMGLLTNHGVLKLDFTKKDDSRELAQKSMVDTTKALANAKTQNDIDAAYGELQALEQNMEMLEPAGAGLRGILPHNLIIDPYAELPDGTDGNWMIERAYLPTNMLIARYTQPDPESDDKDDPNARVLLYKPTHKAQLNTQGNGERDDGLGLVLEKIEGATNIPTSYTDDERTAFLNMYYTECYYVWDKSTRRIMLFHRDDWKWPLWVWDDTLNITRFYPYFVFGFSMSTGGTVSVGETAYYLDQQDEINDINRQMSRIRRSIFDYFFYNSDVISKDEAEKFVDAIRGRTKSDQHVIGVKAGEKEVSKMIEALQPPSSNYEHLFDKKSILDTINRMTNTSDALRGVQFSSNTNEAAVNTYQESMQLSVGSKVDVVEDIVADLAVSLAEICIQQYDEIEVAGLVGPTLATGWQQMDLATFKSQYSLEIVAGSMEKPNSVFKKKEAVQVAQAIGQFAQAAPGATLQIMLRVLEQAFTEIVIKPEDWDAIDSEIQSNATKGQSTTGAPAPGGSAAPQQAGATGQQNDLKSQMMNLPDAVKHQVVAMKQKGAAPEQIKAFLMRALQANQQPSAVQQQAPAPQPAPQAA